MPADLEFPGAIADVEALLDSDRLVLVRGDGDDAEAMPAPVSLFRNLIAPMSVALGTIAVSTAGFVMSATLDDGLDPGDLREVFTLAEIDATLENVGMINRFAALKTNGELVTELVMPTIYDGAGGYVAGGQWNGINFHNPNDADDLAGIAHWPTGGVVLGHRIDPNSGQLAQNFRAVWETPATGTEANSVCTWSSTATGRIHIKSENALVIEAKAYEREIYSATPFFAAAKLVPYRGFVSASSDSATIHYSNFSTTNKVTPLGASSSDAAVAAFNWGTFVDAPQSYTAMGSLMPDGSILGKGVTLTPANNVTALSVSGSSLTGSNTQSLVNLAQTWNTTGHATAFKLNVTNTASGANSLVFDWQVGGVSFFQMTKAGVVNMVGALNAAHVIPAAGGTLSFNTRSKLSSPSDGKLMLQNAAGTDFSMLLFGGSTSSFSAWKRSGTALQSRLADDSDYADLRAKGSIFASVALSPAADTVPFSATGYSVTGSGSSSFVDLAGTWNTSGSPTAFKLNITNTASGANALLADWQIGGSSMFKVSPRAQLTLGSQASSSIDPGFLLSRNLFDGLSGSAHGFVCTSYVRRGGGVAYAPFDAYTIMAGNSYDHYAAFQSRPRYQFSSSGQTVANHYGTFSYASIDTGTVTNFYHHYAAAPLLTNGGAMGLQVAYFAEALAGANDNWAFWADGETPSRFGFVTIDGPSANYELIADAATAASFYAQVEGDDYARVLAGVSAAGEGQVSFGPGNASRDWIMRRISTGVARVLLANEIDLASLQVKLRTEANAVTETIVPDKTIILYDAAGTAYKVPCLAA